MSALSASMESIPMRRMPFAPLFLAVWAIAVSMLAGVVRAESPSTVVLVCEHGSVKSLMAASMFNQSATRRGLPFRAIARGVTPDEVVPPKIASALLQEGFDVKGFKPTRLGAADLVGASQVVSIGVDLSAFTRDAATPLEAWNDVPAASENYAAARSALQSRVNRLLDELQARAHPPEKH